MATLNDALDFKVLAHINGLEEVKRCARAASFALDQLDKAIEALSVEMEVE